MLDAHTLLHFGQTKIWVENDRDAAHFSASCILPLWLHASNLQLYFLTDERQLSRSEAFWWHD